PEELILVAVPPPASRRRCPLFVLFLTASRPVLCLRMRLSILSTCRAVLSFGSAGRVWRARGEMYEGQPGRGARRRGTTRVCEDIGGQVLACGRRVSPEEWAANINAIGAKTLRNVC
ncbi:unnamed protein product, partial [Staurois parvus]